MKTKLLHQFEATPLTLRERLRPFDAMLRTTPAPASIPITRTGWIEEGTRLLLREGRCQGPQSDSQKVDRYEIHEVLEAFDTSETCMTVDPLPLLGGREH